ncbi:class I SAM-dependent methyltransferase [Synechococcus moorigangaii CMS01]|nr:class I SAM-dependent methyltransferase [Synechococcus moorigangaii CMS01]
MPMAPPLLAILQEKLQMSPQQQLTFAEFMELALYHPTAGYYSSGKVAIGAQGDFFTATSLGPDFGELLAEQLLQMKQILGRSPFQVVEMGAGKGDLAQDILSYLEQHYPEDIKDIEYYIIEKSPALRQQQQEKLATFSQIKIQWCDWSDLSENSLQGCFLSNELLDAFPVHLVTVQAGELKEIYIEYHTETQSLQELSGPLSRPQISAYFERLNLDFSQYPNGYRTEVNLGMLSWLEQLQTKLKAGYILTVDYGYPATKYYHPQRSRGTLQCYFQHRRHDNPYVNLGAQDLTAHVDFTSLQNYGESLGLVTLGLTQQGLFLMALGLGDRLNALSQNPTDVMTLFRRRDALHQLIDPTGLGGFYVLLQGKNLSDRQLQIPLKGLTQPPML